MRESAARTLGLVLAAAYASVAHITINPAALAATAPEVRDALVLARAGQHTQAQAEIIEAEKEKTLVGRALYGLATACARFTRPVGMPAAWWPGRIRWRIRRRRIWWRRP
jgi:hypothetical protein